MPTARERAHFFDIETGKNDGRISIKGNAQTGLVIIDSLAYYSEGYKENKIKCFNLHTQATTWEAPVKDVTGTPIIKEDRILQTELYVAANPS